MIKKLLFFPLLASTFCLFACNDDDNENSEEVEEQQEYIADEQDVDEEIDEQDEFEIVVESPEDFIARIGLGWNLGNQMDAYGNDYKSNETCWGNSLCTQATMDGVKAAGFKTVRIPVTYLGHIGEAPDYTIDADWLKRVHEIVSYCKNADLNAIINIHHDGADSEFWLSIKDAASSDEKNEQIEEQIAAMWSQIAEEFKDEGNFLIFESFNEIHNGSWGWGQSQKEYDILNQWNNLFVNTVRNSDSENNKNRYLGIPVYCTSARLFQYLEMPEKSENIAVAIHYYEPGEFAMQQQDNDGNVFSQWGNDATNSPSWGNEDYVKETFASIQSTAEKLKCPVYFGEMGCVHLDENDIYRLYYLEYITKACQTYNIAPIYWDNGAIENTGINVFGIIDHGTGKIVDVTLGQQVIDAMNKGYYTDDSNYTLDSVEVPNVD